MAGLLVAVGIGAAILAGEPDTHPPARSERPIAGSLVQLDADGNALVTIPVPTPQNPTQSHSVVPADDPLVVGQGGVWTLRQRRILFHVDPVTDAVRAQIALDVPTFARTVNLAEGLDAIWAAHGQGLIRVKPATDDQETVARIPAGSLGTTLPADVAVGLGHVWVGTARGLLLRHDPASEGTTEFDGLDPIDAIAVGHDAVWTIDSLAGAVTRYEATSLRVEDRIPVDGVEALVTGETAMWALSRSLGSLASIDAETGEVVHRLQVGPSPTAIAAGLGAIWVGDEDGVIRRVDEDTRQVREILFGAEVRGLTVDDETESLWVDVA